MIVSRGTGNRYVVIDNETGKVLNDVAILQPFVSEEDCFNLAECTNHSPSVANLYDDANRYWQQIHAKAAEVAEEVTDE